MTDMNDMLTYLGGGTGALALVRLGERLIDAWAKKRRNGNDPQARTVKALEEIVDHVKETKEHTVRAVDLAERHHETMIQLAGLTGTAVSEIKTVRDRLEREVIPAVKDEE